MVIHRFRGRRRWSRPDLVVDDLYFEQKPNGDALPCLGAGDDDRDLYLDCGRRDSVFFALPYALGRDLDLYPARSRFGRWRGLGGSDGRGLRLC